MTTEGSAPPMDRTLPINRRSLHDEVVSRVRDMIIEGRLAPGQRVHEGQLGLSLGISRTPLREALKYLASEGLVDLIPGRGARVRRLEPQDVREMLDVLAALESLASRLVSVQASEEEIAGLRALHERMLGFYRARDRLEYYKCNQAVHSRIVSLSGNRFLAATHETIQSRLKRIRFIGNEGAAKWKGAVGEHEEMIVALERRDGEALAEIMARHLRKTWERVKDII